MRKVIDLVSRQCLDNVVTSMVGYGRPNLHAHQGWARNAIVYGRVDVEQAGTITREIDAAFDAFMQRLAGSWR